jgi:dihydroneopterin aldolase
MNGVVAMADRVSGHGLTYQAHVGFGEGERAVLQNVKVDFEARTDWRASARADRARNIVDYAEVDKGIAALISSRHWRLIETMAEAIAQLICQNFPVDQVRVTVTKQPADMPHCAGVSVSCSRTPADFLT